MKKSEEDILSIGKVKSKIQKGALEEALELVKNDRKRR